MTPYTPQQIADAVSELRFRSIKDTHGKLLKSLSKSALYAKINYLKTILEVGTGDFIADYQEPFTRGEWLNFLDIERLRRTGNLTRNKSAEEKLTKAVKVLTKHNMLKDNAAAKIVEVRPARPAFSIVQPIEEQVASPITSQEPTPTSIEDIEVCYYITKGDADKKSYVTYSSSALYFVGNHKQANTFPKEVAEEIIAVLDKTVGIKSNEQFVLQQAENTYFIIFDGYPISLSGQKVERVGNIGQATPYKDKVSAMDAIAALEILFGFVLSKFSILAEIPNSDKTVTVWPVQGTLTNHQPLTNHA